MANDDKVTVLNSCLVQPALPTPSSPIWLSNLDLFAAPTHVRAVYFFRPSSSSPSPAATSLKASLSRILVPYYPFAGRFSNPPNSRRHINCTAEGALFFEAVSNLTLDEFGVYTPSLQNCRLLVPTDGLIALDKTDDSTIPILMAQLTSFKCGGLCLGTALHHQASDGISAMRFVRNWAAATRDPARPFPTPCFDRTSLRARSPPSVQFHHPEFDLRPRREKQAPVSFTYLGLTRAQLAGIKAACGGEYSSYESIAAYIWRCACLAIGPGGADEEMRLLITADVRRRLRRRPLPREFVGNAIVVTVAIAASGEVAAEWPAGRVREAIEKVEEEEYLRSAVDCLELKEDKRRLARSAGNFAETDISVTSWKGLPMYEADFGWGSPEFMGHAAFFYPRQFVVMPSLDGGVKVGCSVEAERMEGFVKMFRELIPGGCGDENG